MCCFPGQYSQTVEYRRLRQDTSRLREKESNRNKNYQSRYPYCQSRPTKQMCYPGFYSRPDNTLQQVLSSSVILHQVKVPQTWNQPYSITEKVLFGTINLSSKKHILSMIRSWFVNLSWLSYVLLSLSYYCCGK